MNQSSIENVQPELLMNSEQKPMVVPSAQVLPMQCYAFALFCRVYIQLVRNYFGNFFEKSLQLSK